MKKVIACLSTIVLFSLMAPPAQAQGILKKLKEKVNDKVNAVTGNNSSSSQTTGNGDNSSSASTSTAADLSTEREPGLPTPRRPMY